MHSLPARWQLLTACILGLAQSQLLAQFSQSSYTFALGDCSQQAQICSAYSQADFDFYPFLLNGQALTSGVSRCNTSTSSTYGLVSLPGDGFDGPYNLVSWEHNGVAVSEPFADADALVAIMLAADPSGGWRIDYSNNILIGGLAGSTYSDIEVYHPATTRNYTLPVTSVMTGGTMQFSFPVGEHVLEVQDLGQVIERVTISVSCPAGVSYESVQLSIPSITKICPDLGALSGPIDANTITVNPAPRFVSLSLTDSDCFNVTALQEGVDSIALRFCDAAGNCATSYYRFEARLAVRITPSTIRDTVTLDGDVITYCIDTTELPGKVISIRDVCLDGQKEFVDFTLVNNNNCLKYRGIKAGGSDTSCIVICDDLGFCDTTRVIVTTTEAKNYPDQNLAFVIDKGSVGSTLLDISSFAVRPNQINNSCPQQSGTFVSFSLEQSTFSVDFAGLEVGTESACIDLKSSDGRLQRFNIEVRVVTRSPGRDTIRIRNGSSQFWCFGPYELPETPVRLFDACPDSNPKVTIANSADVTCVNLTATKLGFQNMCFQLCDAEDRCDVVNLVVEVLPRDDDRLPRAIDDVVFVPLGGQVTLQPLANDISADPITYVSVVSAPTLGAAAFDVDGNLSYQLTSNDCGPDQMVYEICNLYGCDQATITFTNDCDGAGVKPQLITATGFSPNGDGANDTWVLRNIEFYPGSVVKVYNRWGARVLEVQNYGNDWDGTFSGEMLPDGTYFYLADLAGAEPVSGYIQIRR